MKTNILGIALVSVIAVAIATPVMAQQTNGQTSGGTNKAIAVKQEPVKAEKKREGLPFKGNVTRVDKDAKTLTVGEKTFQITSETKIKKAGKDAMLQDVTVGEEVGLSYKTADGGKLVALTVRVGPKPEGKQKKSPSSVN